MGRNTLRKGSKGYSSGLMAWFWKKHFKLLGTFPAISVTSIEHKQNADKYKKNQKYRLLSCLCCQGDKQKKEVEDEPYSNYCIYCQTIKLKS